MDSLYKYFDFDKNLKSSLQEGYLWFSNPASFNDPFEFKLQVDQFLQDEDILEYFEFYKQRARNPSKLITEDFNKVLYGYRKDPEKFLNLFLEPLRNHINSFGVCCFSRISDNILMWSHYANKHSGVVVEFDAQILDKSIYKMNHAVIMTVIDQVIYSSEFPIIKISASHKKTSDEIKKVVFTKSSDWEYEKEVRLISNLSGKHFFDKNCIKKIYLGHKFSAHHKKELDNLLKSYFPNQNIPIRELKIDDRTYSLKIKS